MRIMGLDFGAKTVGVAVSDPLGITAQPLEVVWRKSESKLRQTYARIEELATEYKVERFVVGLPKHMNDEEGDRAALSREFAQNLERRSGIETVMWDERLSTVAAGRVLTETGVRKEKQKEHIDAVAASFILQSYMDYLKNQAEEVWKR
ncbi:MAG: Holliday junction resolvase RuvX [Lachnospiraceae bacterium]|nr:Holliday junction resolvase RuvX [Lachnospiraceae bacterium]